MYVILGIFFFLVYATTAANPYESSYACYYDKKRQTYLGDVYSVKWMENSDAVCDMIYFSFIFAMLSSKVVRSFSNDNSGPWISR